MAARSQEGVLRFSSCAEPGGIVASQGGIPWIPSTGCQGGVPRMGKRGEPHASKWGNPRDRPCRGVQRTPPTISRGLGGSSKGAGGFQNRPPPPPHQGLQASKAQGIRSGQRGPSARCSLPGVCPGGPAGGLPSTLTVGRVSPCHGAAAGRTHGTPPRG